MALKTSFRTTLSHFLYKGPAFHTAKIYCNCMHFILGCSGASNIALLVIVELFLVVSHLLTRSFRANEMKDSSRSFGVSAFARTSISKCVIPAKWYNTYYFKEVRFGGRGFLFSFEKWTLILSISQKRIRGVCLSKTYISSL